MNHQAFALRASTLIALVSFTAAPLAGCSGSSAGMPGLAPSQPAGTGTALGGVTPALMPRGLRARKNLVSESVLYSFVAGNGPWEPYAGLTNIGGVLYGTSYKYLKAYSGYGCVFKVTLSGAETDLHVFSGSPDGAEPTGNVIRVNGALYGTTERGGADNDGTVFEITHSGKEKVLHSFAGGTDGENPRAGLTDVNGVLYGTSSYNQSTNYGTVFTIATNGSGYKVLHTFAGEPDGAYPYAGLTNVNGTLYGTTKEGGANNDGTIFSITTSGTEAVLHSFSNQADGAAPYAGLTNVKNTLYGTTAYGGASYNGTVFEITTSGSGFKTLYSFAGGPSDGANPEGQLLVLDGGIFGATLNGGSNGLGTVFEILPSFYGSETVLYSFAGGGYDGASPYAGPISVKGAIYGTTYAGGLGSTGIIYQMFL